VEREFVEGPGRDSGGTGQLQDRYVYRKKQRYTYEGWNFNSGNYLFTTDSK